MKGETAVFQAPATITPQYAQLAAILRRQSRKAAAAAEAGHGHGHGKGHDHDHEEHGECTALLLACTEPATFLLFFFYFFFFFFV